MDCSNPPIVSSLPPNVTCVLQMIQAAQALYATEASIRPWGFGIAAIQEGVTLRAHGYRGPIIMFAGTPPGEVLTVGPTVLLSIRVVSPASYFGLVKWLALKGRSAWNKGYRAQPGHAYDLQPISSERLILALTCAIYFFDDVVYLLCHVRT